MGGMEMIQEIRKMRFEKMYADGSKFIKASGDVLAVRYAGP